MCLPMCFFEHNVGLVDRFCYQYYENTQTFACCSGQTINKQRTNHLF